MSEAEHSLLRQRLNAGRRSKVPRGAYVQRLPTGLVRLADKSVVTDPDPQIRHVIELVLTQFEQRGSCSRVLRSCKQHDLVLPRRQVSGAAQGKVLGRKPSASAIGAIVTNPADAGAFVHGRRTSDPSRQQPGRRTPAMVRQPMAQWQRIIHGASPAYISWEQYLANQARLGDNAQRYTEPSRRGPGATREGAALLQGLAPCGLCGHRMRGGYRPRSRYICAGRYRTFAEPTWGRLDGPSIEACVVQAFCNAIAPAQLDTLDEVLAQRQRDHQRLETYQQQQVSQARDEAEQARHRDDQVDPSYRLVAAALERDWDEKLRALRQGQEAAESFAHQPCQPTLPPGQRRQLLTLSHTLPDLWQGAQLQHDQRKAFLRSLIARVILKRASADRIEVKIVWGSGHCSQGVVMPPILRQRDLTGYDTMVERLYQLWREGYRDTQSADRRSREGFRSARRDQVSAATVCKIRKQHQWVSRYQQHRFADKRDSMGTVRGLAGHLGVGCDWLSNRIRSGLLGEPEVMRRPPYGLYLIRDEAQVLARLRAEVNRSHRRESGTPS
jgi:hypothetical protein